MSGYCPDCGNTLCVCCEPEHAQVMPSITDEYERLQKLLVDSIDEIESLKAQLAKYKRTNQNHKNNISRLNIQLAKAVEVIEFYGNCEQWITDKVGVSNFVKLDEDIEQIGNQRFAGKRAREFLIELEENNDE